MSSAENVQVGVAVLLTSASHPGCVLLGKRKGSHGSGKIALPGGHLEFGEKWEQCAEREVLEETDLKVSDLRFVTCTNDIMPEDKKHYITIFLHGRVPDGATPKLMEPDKCEGWDWVSWSSVAALSAEAMFVPLHNFVSLGIDWQ